MPLMAGLGLWMPVSRRASIGNSSLSERPAGLSCKTTVDGPGPRRQCSCRPQPAESQVETRTRLALDAVAAGWFTVLQGLPGARSRCMQGATEPYREAPLRSATVSSAAGRRWHFAWLCYGPGPVWALRRRASTVSRETSRTVVTENLRSVRRATAGSCPREPRLSRLLDAMTTRCTGLLPRLPRAVSAEGSNWAESALRRSHALCCYSKDLQSSASRGDNRASSLQVALLRRWTW